jgi:hypothetical protein
MPSNLYQWEIYFCLPSRKRVRGYLHSKSFCISDFSITQIVPISDKELSIRALSDLSLVPWGSKHPRNWLGHADLHPGSVRGGCATDTAIAPIGRYGLRVISSPAATHFGILCLRPSEFGLSIYCPICTAVHWKMAKPPGDNCSEKVAGGLTMFTFVIQSLNFSGIFVALISSR